MGLLQGATELFPVSSLGHSVVLPALLHWSYRQSDPTFVPFLTLLHLGTAGALLILYREDWARIAVGFFRAALRGRISAPEERLSMLLLVGTVPAGLVGFFFESALKILFTSPRIAAALLVVNGAVLLAAEWFRRRDERRRAATRDPQRVLHERDDPAYQRVEGLTLRSALIVGFCQVGALFPGISRSGITMASGLVAGLRHEEAARFSFLLATPIILAAGLLEVPNLGSDRPLVLVSGAAAAVAGVVAYVSARFLLRYLRVGRLDPFAYYCAALGAATLILVR